MKKTFRKCKLTDFEVQKGILIRMLIYWVFCIFFMLLPLSFVRTYNQPETLWTTHLGHVCSDYWPVLITMVAALPFAIYDALCFSNRLVGPVFRLRKELSKLKTGEDLNTIQFRQKDFWSELSEGYNHMTVRISELESQLSDASPKQPESADANKLDISSKQ